MLDYLKIKVTNAKIIKYFKEHHLLYFHSEREMLLYDKETITNKYTKQYNGILFEFTKNTLYIAFKPHYYFNDGLHNANDFSDLNCVKTLHIFLNIFKVDAKHLLIINIEFGLNLIIPKTLIDVKDLLVYMVYHEQNQFRTDRKYIHCIFSSSTDKKGKANVYKIIKAYAKGVQFPNYTDLNTFRFEVKSNRTRYINRLGIKTFEDLLNPKLYDYLSSVILKEFDEVLIIDDTAKPKLSKTRLNNFKKKLNPIAWGKFLNKSKNVFRRNIKSYNEALATCETHLKKELRALMVSKLDELKMCAVSSIYIDELSTYFYKQDVAPQQSKPTLKENRFLFNNGIDFTTLKENHFKPL